MNSKGGKAASVPVYIHYAKNNPSKCHKVFVPSYKINVGGLIESMLTQGPKGGWGVPLDGKEFALCPLGGGKGAYKRIEALFKDPSSSPKPWEPLNTYTAPHHFVLINLVALTEDDAIGEAGEAGES